MLFNSIYTINKYINNSFKVLIYNGLVAMFDECVFGDGVGYLEQSSREIMENEWTENMARQLNDLVCAANMIMIVKSLMSVQDVSYTFCGMRSIQVTLANGRKVSVNSAAFVIKRINRQGRPVKRRRNVTVHPVLELLGFIDKKSPEFLSTIVRAAVSSSSFAAASSELSYRGIKVSAEQIRTLTYQYADLFMANRVENALDGSEKQSGLILEITADGGRTRMREDVKLKNKRRKKGSYNGKWREPVLISIRCLNKKGDLAQKVPQVIDATMKNWVSAFGLLKEYLSHYNLKDAKQITFIADGSKSIWGNVKPMTDELGITGLCTEVVDHMHARQNMNEVLALMAGHQSKDDQRKTKKEIYDLLWEGKIKEIRERVIEIFGSKRRGKKAALKKLDNYFENEARFAYSTLKAAGHPVGSGTVESAVRRVINMKLKSNGIFWLKNNCERMLYLRSQFLTGRWKILQDKLEIKRVNAYGYNMLQDRVDAA